MKEFVIPEYDLGVTTLDHAFEVVFEHDTILQSHGDSLVATEWENNKRKADYFIEIEHIPWALRHLFKASGVQVSLDQTLVHKEKEWTVFNDIKLHFIGARFFKTQSHFTLSLREDNHVFLSGGIRSWAKLLPPLNRIAESFIISQCKKEIETYTQVVTNKFVSEQSKD